MSCVEPRRAALLSSPRDTGRASQETAPKDARLLVLPLDRGSEVSLQTQLHDALVRAIRSGQLPPGTRLPSSRDLARAHGLARNTVVSVYERLEADGLLVGRVGEGTFVADTLREAAKTKAAAPGSESPPPPLARRTAALASLPDHVLHDESDPRPFALGIAEMQAFARRAWQQCLRRVLERNWRRVLAPGEAQGARELREAIAATLVTTRGIPCTADRVVITQGSQQAIDLTMRAVVDPGTAVWLEDPGYFALRAPALAMGGKLVPVPVDAEGMDLGAAAQAPPPRLVCVTPTHQFPLGVTLSSARRRALLELAERTPAWILEDDYDGEFFVGSRPHLSLLAEDRTGRVIHAGTFSKTMASGLRTGFLVLPEALVDTVVRLRYLGGQHNPALEQLALAEFLRTGAFARHVAAMRRLYARRRRLLVAELGESLPAGCSLECARGGLHAVLHLPAHVDDVALAERGAGAGLDLRPLRGFLLDLRWRRRGLLLGLGAVSDARLRRACAALRELLADFAGRR